MIKNLIITILAVCGFGFCTYKLLTADCSYLNYIYLAGILLIPLLSADSFLTLINKK